jgi:RNA polymerase II subunit A C-terminal domain phosphatase SSU72
MKEEDNSNKASFRFAVVCSSNQNRSMEAHNIFSKKGLNVRSFGTGKEVKLPGFSASQPNVYEFGKTTYEQMYKDLQTRDKSFYTNNGILHMLERNKRIKLMPERFQECKDQFDIIFTVEERIFDQLVEGILTRFITISKISFYFILILKTKQIWKVVRRRIINLFM